MPEEISKKFDRNDHHIKTMYHIWILCLSPQGQGHCGHLKFVNIPYINAMEEHLDAHLWPITLSTVKGFWNYLAQIIVTLVICPVLKLCWMLIEHLEV